MNNILNSFFLIVSMIAPLLVSGQLTYPIVDTDVHEFYDNTSIISAPSVGQAFYGQDASYNGHQPSYTDNGDGTITDNVTGLMWEKNMGSKITFDEAFIKADNSTLGGYSDWRVPTIKELVSLTYYSGHCFGNDVIDKFIDTNYFDQPIGDTSIGEREIDAQTWSQTLYVGLTMAGDTTVFGMNFVDGRLKGYPKYNPQNGNPMSMYFRMVRGNTSYGLNNFLNNGDGTITDIATGLMWQQSDNGSVYDWESALLYAEGLVLAGHDDWRLPNMKELHSILDYTRCPDITNSPAIDPLFMCTEIDDPEGDPGQYGYYWTSSPLLDGASPYSSAVYICFGEAQGQMESPPMSGNFTLMDVHGAGSVRNDPKSGNPTDYPQYWGPQGDVQYVFNFVRCVRDIESAGIEEQSLIDYQLYPNPAQDEVDIVTTSRLIDVTVYSSIGERVINIEPNGLHISMNTSALENGVYLVHLSAEDGSKAISTLMITK